jgi:hypothetical protein
LTKSFFSASALRSASLVLCQHAFGADAVGDIDKGDHGLAVGQRHHGIVENEACGQFDAAVMACAALHRNEVISPANSFQPSGSR